MKSKQNLDYFKFPGLDQNTDQLEFLFDKYGVSGYGFYIRLLQYITSGKQCKVLADDAFMFKFMREVQYTEDEYKNIINFLCENKLIGHFKDNGMSYFYNSDIESNLQSVRERRDKNANIMRKKRYAQKAKK